MPAAPSLFILSSGGGGQGRGAGGRGGGRGGGARRRGRRTVCGERKACWDILRNNVRTVRSKAGVNKKTDCCFH